MLDSSAVGVSVSVKLLSRGNGALNLGLDAAQHDALITQINGFRCYYWLLFLVDKRSYALLGEPRTNDSPPGIE